MSGKDTIDEAMVERGAKALYEYTARRLFSGFEAAVTWDRALGDVRQSYLRDARVVLEAAMETQGGGR